MVPAVAWCAGSVSATARGQYEELGVTKQACARLGVERQPWRDEVVHPRLHGAGRTVVVQRKSEQEHVGALDLVDQLDAARERRGLRRRVVGGRDHPGQAARGVEVRDRVCGEVAIGHRSAGVGGVPPLRGARGQSATDRAVALNGRVDVQQVRHE